jgi:hypothetical protein
MSGGTPQRRQLPRLAELSDVGEMLDAIAPFVAALNPAVEGDHEPPPLPWEVTLLMNQLARVSTRGSSQQRGKGSEALQLAERVRADMNVLCAAAATGMGDLSSLKNVAWALNSAKRVPTAANDSLFSAAAVHLEAWTTRPVEDAAGEGRPGEAAGAPARPGVQNIALVANALLDHAQGAERRGGKARDGAGDLVGAVQAMVRAAVREPREEWGANPQALATLYNAGVKARRLIGAASASGDRLARVLAQLVLDVLTLLEQSGADAGAEDARGGGRERGRASVELRLPGPQALAMLANAAAADSAGRWAPAPRAADLSGGGEPRGGPAVGVLHAVARLVVATPLDEFSSPQTISVLANAYVRKPKAGGVDGREPGGPEGRGRPRVDWGGCSALFGHLSEAASRVEPARSAPR